MNEFSMILRDSLLDDREYRIVTLRLLDERGADRKKFIEIISDRIRDDVGDWYYYGGDEESTQNKLIDAMLRRIDFKSIAALLYTEAVETKKVLDAKRIAATAEYKEMVFDNPDQILAVIKCAEDCKGDVDKVAKGLEANEYRRLLKARGIQHESEPGAGKALRDARLINYMPIAEMACEKYRGHNEDEDETAVKEEAM